MASQFIISKSGMGGFLNPPGHPEHNYSVVEKRGGHEVGYSALSSIEGNYYFPGTIRRVAKGLLQKWERNKPSLDSPEVQDWIRHVLGYFRGCYKAKDNGPACWNASNLRIRRNWNPMKHVNAHAGVHLIRKYYPDYTPEKAHFAEAYWGKKPNGG